MPYFLGKRFSSPFFIAASPITSTTCRNDVGSSWRYNQEELRKKIKFLLYRYKIGAVILKSVYYPEQKSEDKPNTRVWKWNGDLFHIGHTPREMFSVNELKEFLNEIDDTIKEKIIISLGIKSSDVFFWEKLFKELFEKSDLSENDIIEINARHTLREINMLFVGDREIDEYAINPEAKAVWKIVKQWFQVLNALGHKYEKKLLLKLPYRSDLINLCSFLSPIIEKNQNSENQNKEDKNYGIRGITLINTIKSPKEDQTARGNLLLCIEESKMQQLSGDSLRGLRNWTIKVINRKFKHIEISASGGLYSADHIIETEIFGARTFQLCSSILTRGLNDGLEDVINKYYKKKDHIFQSRKKQADEKIGKKSTFLVNRRITWNKNKCSRCMECLKTFYCDAFLNKYLIYYKNEFVTINGQRCFIPERFYPDVYPAYCTGCGLCIQVCPTGALNFARRVYYRNKIILASKSPRRKRLLQELIRKNFDIMQSCINEDGLLDRFKEEPLSKIAMKIAIEKARSVVKELKIDGGILLIAADTLIVTDDNEIIGKPKNSNHAREILQKLSGKRHQVFSGVAVIDTKVGKELLGYDTAYVKFKKLQKAQIDEYIKSNKWCGKAGGYNIEDVESEFVEKIEGDRNTVIGLPLNKLKDLLTQSGLKDLISK